MNNFFALNMAQLANGITGFALSPIANMVGIFGRKGMPIHAKLLSFILGTNSLAPKNILTYSHYFHMGGINAKRVLAQVVNNQSFGYIANQCFKRIAVCHNLIFSLLIKLTILPMGAHSTPKPIPTFKRTCHLNLRPKSIGGWGGQESTSQFISHTINNTTDTILVSIGGV